VSGSVASYEVAGFSCQVGNVIFSNFNVNTLNATVTGFIPFSNGGEDGLILVFSANAANGSSTDVSWIYNVTAAPGFLIDDAFASFNGTVTGGAGNGSVLSEQLLNSQNVEIGRIDLGAPGSQTITFAPQESLFALKDQANFTGEGGTSS